MTKELKTALVIEGRVDGSLRAALRSATGGAVKAGKTTARVSSGIRRAYDDQVGAARRTATATIRVGAALTTASAASVRTVRSAEKVGRAFSGVGRSATTAVDTTTRLGSSLAGVGSAGGKAAGSARRVGSALDTAASAAGGAATESARVGGAMAEAGAAAQRLGTSTTRVGGALDRTDREARATRRGWRAWAQEVRRTDTVLGKSVRQIERTRRALRGLARDRRSAMDDAATSGEGGTLGDLAGGVAMGAAIRGSFREALTVGDATAHLRTVINADDPDRAVDEAVAYAKDFARANLGSEAEIINIQYALNSAGLEASVARVGSGVVSQVATVTKGVKEEVGNVIATVYTNLGKGLEGTAEERITRVGDVLAKAQALFKFKDFGQLGESFSTSAAAISRAQVPLEQAAVALGVLNNAGLEGSESGTAYSAVLRQLTKAQEELGASIVRDASGNMDLIATIGEIEQALAFYDDIDERNDIVQKVFGDEGARGITPLIAALKDLRKMENEVAEGSRGFTSTNYQRMLGSAPAQVGQLGENLRGVGSAIAESFFPALESVLPPLNAVVGHVGKLITDFPQLGLAVGGAAAAFTTFKAVSITRSVGGLLKGLRQPNLAGADGGVLGGVRGPTPVQVVNWPRGGGFGVGAEGRSGRGRRAGAGARTRVGGAFASIVRGGGPLPSLGGAARVLGRVATPLAVGLGALQLGKALGDGDGEEAASAAGGMGGAAAGAMAGAAAGSVVPVLGTAIGGIVGGVLGGLGGEALGRTVFGWFGDDADEERRPFRRRRHSDEPMAVSSATNAAAANGADQTQQMRRVLTSAGLTAFGGQGGAPAGGSPAGERGAAPVAINQTNHFTITAEQGLSWNEIQRKVAKMLRASTREALYDIQ